MSNGQLYYSVTSEDGYYGYMDLYFSILSEENKTCELAKAEYFWGEKYDYVLTVPKTVYGYTVKGVGRRAFNNLGAYNWDKPLTVVLPNSIEYLANEAFKEYPRLLNVTLSNGVKSIGSEAFDNSGLQSIVIPNSVETIGANAFENCVNLSSVILPEGLTKIPDWAFAGCSNLKSITVNWSEPIDLATPASVRGLQTRSDGNTVFEGVDKATCILYVPNGSVEAYKAAEVWKEFKIIKPISETGINGIVYDGVSFDVYDLQGRKVRQNVTTLKGLPSGIYIVNGKKIAIR